MKHAERLAELEPWLVQLRAIPFVQAVGFRGGKNIAEPLRAQIKTPATQLHYLVEVRRAANLGSASLATLIEDAKRNPDERLLLFAPYVSSSAAARLRAAGIDFVDAAGNCHISADPRLMVHIEGRKAVEPMVDGRARPRTPGNQVLFALAARPALAAAGVRELAQLSGVGKSASAEMLSRLTKEGLLIETRSGRRVASRKRLIERWLGVYPDVRERWLQGTYRSAEPVDELERRVERALHGKDWAWGGTAAEMRLVGHYRGQGTVLHVATPVSDLPRSIRALPDRDGPVAVLVTPLPIAYEGVAPHTVHPLLVYSELVTSGDERAIAAATLLAERWLEDI